MKTRERRPAPAVIVCQQIVLAGLVLALGAYAAVAWQSRLPPGARNDEKHPLLNDATLIAAFSASFALVVASVIVPMVATRVRRGMLRLADPSEIPLPGGGQGKWRGRLAMVYPAVWGTTVLVLAAGSAANLAAYRRDHVDASLGIAAIMAIWMIAYLPTTERREAWIDRQLRRHDEEKVTRFQ